MPRHARGRSRDPRKTRLLALAGVVAVCAVALPLAVASAGSVHSVRSEGAADRGGPASGSVQGEVRPSTDADDKAIGGSKSAPSAVPTLPTLGQGLATAVRCGPEVSSPDGIEAQTCVVTQGAQTWARTYYRNATGEALDAVLTLMEPGARTVRMTCAVSAEDEPRTCETPREPVRGDLAAYTAVAEFARRAGQGPLLLRSGSNSPVWTGS
ncbi:hypothetical protein [Streptomyces purpurascens]|uniref:Uncharacterized protein n=1 Tax=Streptomyces purpurascens TaxID=1924 RepID=A0ABZ1MK83_STREF|nr:hypothetical protein [Streptomyces purpurascens]MCE7046696.1 hypothetical protein [Streptomyces purpurascens]GHA42579.1 hypothetical protein GCM10010303_62180 [Streptomyces purpurascens]